MALLPSNAMELADKKFDKELSTRLEAVKGISKLHLDLRDQTCVASNSSLEYIRQVLATTLLSGFFDDRLFSSRDLGRHKPEPDVFLQAAKQLGFSPLQCIVVEDSVSGTMAAQNAGMLVVGFMGELHFNKAVREKLLSAKADYYCDSAEQLFEVLESIPPATNFFNR